MANLAKLEFAALTLSGNNYLPWLVDMEIHLNAKGLGDTILEGNNESAQNKAKAIMIIRHHIQEELKNEYLTIKNPLDLWKNLRKRYDHQRSMVLPKAKYDWMNLRFKDFKSVSDYNSAMFRIVSRLRLCGEEVTEEAMIEKTLSTFHTTHLLIQEMYRLKDFKEHSELMTHLLVAEQNNELLVQNNNARPTGSTPFPEANGTSFQKQEHNRGRGRGRGRGGWDHKRSSHQSPGESTHVHQKLDKFKQKRNDWQDKTHKPPKDYKDVCYRCGSKGHWARVCRTQKHLVELYQAATGQTSRDKRKDQEQQKPVETNFINIDDDTHLDVSDFLEDSYYNLEIGNDSETIGEPSNAMSHSNA